MKSLMMMLIVVAAAVAEGQTQRQPAAQVQMKSFAFQGAQFQGTGTSLPVLGGTVAVTASQIDLSMQFQQACPPNALCAQVMATPYATRLPVVAIQPSLCGDRYIAQIDRTPVDGVAEKIEIVDYSRATCEIMLPSIARAVYTRVAFDRRLGRRVVHTYHINLNALSLGQFQR